MKETETVKLVGNLSSNKSLGLHGIPVKVSKNRVHSFKQPFTQLNDLSFQQGVYPDALKAARVTPTFIKGDPKLPSNCRSFSVLSVFTKLFEKCIYSRLYYFLTKYNVPLKKQFGFRNNHSTNHALVGLLEIKMKYLDNDCYVCGVFINLRKTFDSVNQDIARLKHYGVHGQANDW